VIRIFPNRESLQRLMGTPFMDIPEGRLTGRHYLSPESVREALTPKKAQHVGARQTLRNPPKNYLYQVNLDHI